MLSREDVAILNFFFDTPIITQINLELRTNIFDQISAIGGTLGLFTGISVITFIEILYWFGKFAREVARSGGGIRWPLRQVRDLVSGRLGGSNGRIADADSVEKTARRKRRGSILSHHHHHQQHRTFSGRMRRGEVYRIQPHHRLSVF